ncbi:MAG TPA: hypothetical protein VKY41_01075 [Xanthomarina sp.]|nr:hypothetical protein [Xanthomarina sp.]
MKKILSLFFALTIILVLNSCSNDDNDDNGSANNSQIVGTWGTEWNDGNGISVHPKFTFMSNGNVKYYTYPSGGGPELEEIGTYNLNGEILIMEFPETVFFKYKNKITFVTDTELEFVQVIENGFDSWSAETYFKTDDPNLN